MPPKPLVDLSSLDLTRALDTIEGIRKYNQQRYEMEMLSGVIAFNPDEKWVVAYKDLGKDDFWVRGHVPGRPLMPGVLICECAAQCCSYYYGRIQTQQRFLGFAGMEAVKFRNQVAPGDRLIMVCRVREMGSRISSFDCQGFVNGKMVFEGVIHGIAI